MTTTVGMEYNKHNRMKATILFLNIFILFLLASCDKQEELDNLESGNTSETDTVPQVPGIPEGYFEVNFAASAFDMQTKAAVIGQDTRVQHVRYIIYNSSNQFVKEKIVLVPSAITPTWPLAVVKDTLPKGSYTVVFLGNIEKTLFPYSTSGSSQNYAEVLTNYKGSYSDARIILPPAEFTDKTEYYWANVAFSDTNPNPNVLLQRIIGAAKLERVFLDGQDALNQLVNNIVTQIGYKNIIRTTVQGILPGLLRAVITPILGNAVAGLAAYVDNLVNPLVTVLVEPLTDLLYNLLLQRLVDQIGVALLGNSDKASLVAYLGVILNPWNDALARNAVVSINNFPKSIDFGLNVKESYTGVQRFQYGFNTEAINKNRYINIKGFNAAYDVRKINVVGVGLISGVVVDQVIDGFLLPGAFVDINDPIQVTGSKTNRRYQSQYALAALGLKSYTQQTDGAHRLTLTVKIGDIANIDNILTTTLTTALNGLLNIPIIGGALSLVLNSLVLTLLSPIKAIEVSVPVNLPLLGIDNLSVSGGWNPNPPTQY